MRSTDAVDVRRARAGLRLSLRPAEAAEALGCSLDFFEEHVRPEIRVVRRGRLVLIPVRELERFLDRNAALTLPGES